MPLSSLRVLVAGLLLAATAHAAPPAEIVVAQVAPFSGPLAGNGEANYAGAKAAFDAANARGSVGGRRIRFVREDDGYKPAETLRLMRLVAERDKPLAFVNVLGSANVAALLKDKVLDELQIPVVGVTPGAESLREPGHPLLFHTVAGDRAQIDAMLRHLATVGVTRVALVAQDLPFGASGVAIAEKLAPERKVQIVGKVTLPPGADDAKPVLASLRALGAQTYVLILAPNSGAAFVRDARDAGDRTPIYSMSYVTARGAIDKAGLDKAAGLALAQVTPNPTVANSGLVREFHAAMKAHGPKGAELSASSLAGYIAARALIKAFEQGNAATPAAVAANLRRLKADFGGYTIDFAGGNVGSRMVDIALLDRAGALRY